jgi:hypothetical protein
MTMQTIPGLGFEAPDLTQYLGNGAPSFLSSAIDASTEKIAMIGQVYNKDRASKNITKIGFRPGTVSLNASSFIKTSIQSVSTSAGPPAQPTGTILGATANGFATEAAATFASNTWHQTAALGEVVAVTHGQLIAIVIEYGTFTAADALNITGLPINFAVPRSLLSLFTGTWGGVTSVLPNVILEFDDGTFGTLDGSFSASAISSITYASNTAGSDEYCMEFSLPFPCKVDGAFVFCQSSAAGSDLSVILYDGTTAMTGGTVAVDGNTFNASASGRKLDVTFDQEIALSANTTYRLALRPDTTSSVVLYYFDVANAAHFQAHSLGTSAVINSRLDGGAWGSATTTRRPYMGLSFSAFDDGAGGGGGFAIPVSGRICA